MASRMIQYYKNSENKPYEPHVISKEKHADIILLVTHNPYFTNYKQ